MIRRPSSGANILQEYRGGLRLVWSKHWLPLPPCGRWRLRAAMVLAAALMLLSVMVPLRAQAATTLTAELTGQQVVPGPGARSGGAQVVAALHARQVCWDLRWDGLEPTDANLHRGGTGEVGPVVVGMVKVRAPIIGQTAREGCTGADPEVIQAMQQNPEGFYAQVRTQQHPDGAVRGQLTTQQPALPRTGVELPSPWAVIAALTVVGLGALVPALVGREDREWGR